MRTIQIETLTSSSGAKYLQIIENITAEFGGDATNTWLWSLPGVSLHINIIDNYISYPDLSFLLIKEGTTESISFKFNEVVLPVTPSPSVLESVLRDYLYIPQDVTGGGGGPITISGPIPLPVLSQSPDQELYRNAFINLIPKMITNTSGYLYKVTIINNNATERYVKFYDSATPPTVGVTPIRYTIPVPRLTTNAGWMDVDFPNRIDFSNGIFVAATNAADDNANSFTGNSLLVQVTCKI